VLGTDGDQLQVSADFECENLAAARLASPYATNRHVKIQARHDPEHPGWRSWFYFSVKGVEPNEKIRFTLENVGPGVKILKAYRPVYCLGNPSIATGKWQHVTGRVEWVGKATPVTGSDDDSDDDSDAETDGADNIGIGRCLSWTFDFPKNREPVYFAFCFPYSTADVIALRHRLQNKCHAADSAMSDEETQVMLTADSAAALIGRMENAMADLMKIRAGAKRCGMLTAKIHKLKNRHKKLLRRYSKHFQSPILAAAFKREVVAMTKGGREVEVWHVSGPSSDTKQVVFISCRVHAGETPANYILEGVLDLLSDPSSCVRAELLQQFDFQIIPILNPDGVAQGHWRSDSLGQDLNRTYSLVADPSMVPSIRAAVDRCRELGDRLYMYLDLHAHLNKTGHFLIGSRQCTKGVSCASGPQVLDAEKQADHELFPYLLNEADKADKRDEFHFDQKNNFGRSPHQSKVATRSSAGRSVIGGGCTSSTTLGVVRAYTVESHYCASKSTWNKAAAARTDSVGSSAHEGTCAVLPEELFGPATWREFGRQLMHALIALQRPSVAAQRDKLRKQISVEHGVSRVDLDDPQDTKKKAMQLVSLYLGKGVGSSNESASAYDPGPQLQIVNTQLTQALGWIQSLKK